MKETGILFKPEMIRAILSGQKTQTRRLIKPQYIEAQSFFSVKGTGEIKFMYTPLAGVGVAASKWIKCPYGRKGDLLYVKEGFALNYYYGFSKWTSPLFMSKRYARIWLELTAEPISQRLQEITEEDAFAEGISEFFKNGLACAQFACLWESINGTGSWKANPWVWKLEFKRIER